ncbi:hypothetical protein [Niallia sp. 03133]
MQKTNYIGGKSAQQQERNGYFSIKGDIHYILKKKALTLIIIFIYNKEK